MSVSLPDYKVQYVLTSANQALAIPFYFLQDSHIRVIRTRSHVETPLTGGFTIAGAGNPSGGTLTLDGSETQVADRITIRRNLSLTQNISYAPNDRFPASTHERGLDEATMKAQQATEIAERGFLFGEGELLTSAHRLPAVPSRERKVLGFKTDGSLDLTVSLEDIRTIIVANPLDELTDVTDYGSVGDPVTSAADYGSIA